MSEKQMSPTFPVPTIPEVVESFADYYRKNPTWGALHIVIEDGNVKNKHVEHCIECALDKGDAIGARLGIILFYMSKSQRLRMGDKVREFIKQGTKQ